MKRLSLFTFVLLLLVTRGIAHASAQTSDTRILGADLSMSPAYEVADVPFLESEGQRER